MDFPGGTVVKNLPADAGDARDVGSISESGSFPGVGNGNPLQYSCLENSIVRGAWRAIVHGVTKRWMKQLAHTHISCAVIILPHFKKDISYLSVSSTQQFIVVNITNK